MLTFRIVLALHRPFIKLLNIYIPRPVLRALYHPYLHERGFDKMAPHVIIDEYNLTIALLITLAWQMIGFFIAWTLQVSPPSTVLNLRREKYC